jgi:hypothetical protein
LRWKLSGFGQRWFDGGVTEEVRDYSDVLAIFLLKAHLPDKYRETIRQQLTDTHGQPLAPAVIAPQVNILLLDNQHEPPVGRLVPVPWRPRVVSASPAASRCSEGRKKELNRTLPGRYNPLALRKALWKHLSKN